MSVVEPPSIGAGTDWLIAYFKLATSLPPAAVEAAIPPAIDAVYTARDQGRDMHRAGAEAAIAALEAVRFLNLTAPAYHEVCWECGAIDGVHRPLCSRDPINRTPYGRMLARARYAPPLDPHASELLSFLRDNCGTWVAISRPDLPTIERIRGVGIDIRVQAEGPAGQTIPEAKLP